MTTAAQQKVAIVTGAGRGIGAAVARHLGGCGWQVVVADVDTGTVSVTAGDIGGVGVACDVGQERDVDRLVAEALRQHLIP